ncbi:FCGR3 protein, partial [Oriolus oriolus]|nr:FCGR3 protein [Oriolus oriolus]
TVTLRCRTWEKNSVNLVHFYHEEKNLQVLGHGTELSLSPLQLQHSGRYHCTGRVYTVVPQGWKESAPVTVTV